MQGLGTYLALLQTQHHGTIESIETSLYLARFLATFVTQLHDERQHLILFCIIERKLRAIQELQMEVGHVLHYDVVYLEMPLLAFAFLVYHSYQVAIPVGEFLALLVRVVCKSADILVLYS